MPHCVHKQLAKYEHSPPKQRHNCSYAPEPRNYGKLAQDSTPKPDSPALNASDKKYVQQIVGRFLYYAQAIDLTIIHALNSIAAYSSKPTERTMETVQQLLDYVCSNPNAIICLWQSDMILNVDQYMNISGRW